LAQASNNVQQRRSASIVRHPRAGSTVSAGLAPTAGRRIPGGGLQPPRFSGRSSYSFFVVLMKVLLPAMAAALVLLLVVWPQLSPIDNHFRVGISKISLDQAESLNMLNPRYDGRDNKNQPFSVTADLASQESGASKVVDLDLPKADLTMEDGTWLVITANSGRYDREAEMVELVDDVVFYHDEGFEVQTGFARIDLKAGSAEGDQAVYGQGPLGSIQSEGFRIESRGQRIFFTGKSRMIVYPNADKGS